MKQLPIDTIQVGPARAAIWENRTTDGKVFFNTTISRTYRDADGNFKSSDSFGVGDLLALAKAADLAHTRCLELRAEHQAGAAAS